MVMKTISISTRIVISNTIKQGIPLWIWWKVNGNWDNNMIRVSQWRENHCRTNTSVRQKKYKRVGLWESQFGIRVVKLTIWVGSFEIKNCNTEFTGSISSTRIGNPVLMMFFKVDEDKHICRWVDWDNIIYVRWNRIKNCAQRGRWLIEEKEVRHLVK